MSDKENSSQVSNIKTAMSLSFTYATEIKNDELDLSSNSLIIVTAAGTIYGTAMLKPSDGNIVDLVYDTAYRQAQELTKPGVSNYCLILKDAILVSGQGFKQSFKTLFVFPDDIIAITFGDTNDI